MNVLLTIILSCFASHIQAHSVASIEDNAKYAFITDQSEILDSPEYTEESDETDTIKHQTLFGTSSIPEYNSICLNSIYLFKTNKHRSSVSLLYLICVLRL